MSISIPKDYIQRAYAGWYGKLIGIRHGSNVEGWSYEQIAEKYGEVSGYLFDFKNFAADDDSNGPIFFIRALEDHTCTEEITSREMGETVLNYVPCQHGFFWWGGYGMSTEHTAYLNLLNGIDAPLSGSVELNGAAVAEQIGGQIFIDTWGLVNPGNHHRAARYAEKMASVTHGGNGVYGGMFVAACVSAAFVEHDILSVIRAGLSVIPEDCEYRRMADAVMAFHREHPSDWRECFFYVREYFGYDRYPGVCHIIPNSAVVLLSLLYGNGDFSRSINICNMCGWDTDCNVANVGCILGVMVGLEGIDASWRAPINDFLACSSVLGCMNLRDITNDAFFLASLGYRIAGEAYPEEYRAILEGSAPRFSFALPDSTHTFRVENGTASLRNIPLTDASMGRCLQGEFPAREQPVRLYRQTYYRPDDFNDDRYSPSFTPEVFPGQTVVLRVRASQPTALRPFAYDAYSQSCLYGDETTVKDWTELKLKLPMSDGCIQKVGVELPAGSAVTVFVDHLTYEGAPAYTLDFTKAGEERWNGSHIELGQTSHSMGLWRMAGGAAYGSCADHGELFTGGIDFRDYTVNAHICPMTGRNHLVMVRAQGAMRGYFAGFLGDRLAIVKNQRTLRTLASKEYAWENGKEYLLTVKADGNKIILSVNGEALLTVEDPEAPYLTGCYGLAIRSGSRCRIDRFEVTCKEA
ncbi:ADP-ribosylglycohydrolase family protein [Neglectibacter caecimuris]|uniref:ADP-ribosylglycohydrolase family protein n=1 Tax=Neglectibacter caecimuris TaxID=3093658 RepID=UPI002AC8F5A9|nr:ADP-ribosylglycohydrolase family protein [Neglectibacter sp. M00184]